MDRIFTALATRIASAAGQPLSFVLAFGLILIWGISGPLFGYSDTWQLVINTGTTIVTFLMVFLIQNSQNRDAAAMQAKLDEVIRALDSAREQFIGIEHRSAVEVENIRAALEKEVGCDQGKAGTADDSVEHVLRRT
jgi:low affinity Fe/Cu permease